MPDDLTVFADSLEQVEDGLWASSELGQVSYPTHGHHSMAEIEDQSFWFQHRARLLGHVLDRYPPTGCVFDVGGGNGFTTRALREAGFDAVVVEPGADGVRVALDRGLTPVINSTLNAAGFYAGTLPAIGLFDVLEHLEGDSDFLCEIHRVLMPGGRVYVTVPAYTWLWSVDDETAGHYRRYTATSLRGVAEEAQFELEFSSYFFMALPLPIFFARSLPSRLGLRNSDSFHATEHRLPPGVVGRMLGWSLARELRAIPRWKLPLGSSLMAVIRKR